MGFHRNSYQHLYEGEVRVVIDARRSVHGKSGSLIDGRQSVLGNSREVFVGRRLELHKYESSHQHTSMTTFLFWCNRHLATLPTFINKSCLCRPTIGTSRVRSCLRRAWMKGNDFYFSFIKRTLLHSAMHSFAYSMVSGSSSSGASSMYFW